MFIDQVEKLCRKKGISITKLTNEVGLGKATASGWRKGSTPHPTTIKKIADYFNVAPDYFENAEVQENVMTGVVHTNNGIIGNTHGPVTIKNGTERTLTEQEVELLHIFNSLDIRKKTALLTYAFDLEEKK